MAEEFWIMDWKLCEISYC